MVIFYGILKDYFFEYFLLFFILALIILPM